MHAFICSIIYYLYVRINFFFDLKIFSFIYQFLEADIRLVKKRWA
jgi:hypothetical protein